MKKIISSILCLIMMVSMSISAFAESNDFVLTYSNEASYEITIPASGTVNKATGKGIIEIDISDANLANGTAVSVTATSANYANGSWYLVNTKDSSDKIAYTIGTTDGANDVASGSEVLSADSATSAAFYITISDTSRVGTFTDTITFTSEIIDAAKLISFTIDFLEGYTFQAEEGMTWGEFIESDYNVYITRGDGSSQKTFYLSYSYLSDVSVMFHDDYDLSLYVTLNGDIQTATDVIQATEYGNTD